jgi:hypothetical protein
MSPLPSADRHVSDEAPSADLDHAASPVVSVKTAESENKPRSPPPSPPPQKTIRKRSRGRAKGKGRPAPNAQACRQNWEALLQGVQLDDVMMLKGKWYWQLRGTSLAQALYPCALLAHSCLSSCTAEKAKADSVTSPAVTPSGGAEPTPAGAQSTRSSGVAQLPVRSRLNSLYQWIQQAK